MADLSCYTAEDADYWSCMWQDLWAAAGGEALLGLFIGAGFMTALYVASDFDPAVPTVGSLLFGPILMAALPPAYVGIGQTVALLGIVVGVFVVGQRYLLEVGT